MRGKGEAGYSALEALMVVAAIATLSAISVVEFRTALRDFQVNSAYVSSLNALRQARQSALAERRVYIVTFVAPATIRIQRREQGGSLTQTNEFRLSFGMQLRAEPGIPTAALQTPDHFGMGAIAIDFNGSNQVYFQPDGSARDSTGRVNNGVLYLARPGDVSSARAVTLFGATGRIKGWRLTSLAWRWM